MSELYAIRCCNTDESRSKASPSPSQYGFVEQRDHRRGLIGPVLGGARHHGGRRTYGFFPAGHRQRGDDRRRIGVLLGETYTEPYVSMFGFCVLFGLC